MTYQHAIGTAALIAVLGAGAQARPAPDTGTPQSVVQLLGCRSITDSAQRLACYDRQTTVVSQAIATRDLVVIDKARATAANRSLFGFSIPNFGGLFGSGADDVKQIDGTIASVGRNPEGGWLIRLADGSVWTQVDDAQLALPPTRGDQVVVIRGSLGSFWVEFKRQPGFKAKRIG